MEQNAADPSSNSSDARAVRSRAAFCTALLSLLEETGFENLTVREITARAGVSYQTFFRHYSGKEALLSDLAAQEIDDLLGMTLPMLNTANSRASAQAICAYVWERRQVWKVLLTGGAAGMLKDELLRKSQGNSMARKAQPSLETQLSTVVAVAGTIEALAWWLKQPSPLSSHRMAVLLDKYVVTPGLTSLRAAREG